MFQSKIALQINNTQHKLIMLIFVCAVLIFLDLGLFSLSFIFGSFLILYSLNKQITIFRISGSIWFLASFLIVALTSILFSELYITLNHVKLYIQTLYWFLLAVIVYNGYPTINKRSLSKCILLSTLVLLILYVIGFRHGLTQNAVAYIVIIFSPLGYFYLQKDWQKAIYAILLIFLMLLNGSRTGAIVSIIQSGLIIILSNSNLSRYFKLTIIILVLLISLFNIEPVRKSLGYAVFGYNQRLGILLKDPELVLRTDKSWLIRRAQVQKGKQIFAEHPILGIGYSNFTKYDVNIDLLKIGIYKKLSKKSVQNRSAHNTYVAILAETGILGFFSIVLLFITLLVRFWKNSNNLGNKFEGLVFVSFIGLLVYFYTISSLMGTNTWIMFGLIAGAANSVKKVSVAKDQEL